MNALIDSDPRSAIETARNLPHDALDQINYDILVACTLVDGGDAADDLSAIEEGIRVFERLAEQSPDIDAVTYNLANGLSAKAKRDPTKLPTWYLATIDLRARARHLYQQTASKETNDRKLRGEAYTNLGNTLSNSYRLIEAYDSYARAIDCDPANGVALIASARTLLRFAGQTNDNGSLLAVAARHLEQAKANAERIVELVGRKGYGALLPFLNMELSHRGYPDLSQADKYKKFVAKHRLFLAPTIEGLDLSLTLWDSLRIESIAEPIGSSNGVPPIFGMFNVLKSDYLAARHIAFSALTHSISESGKYSDTLDYACYGIESSLLTLAQRACVDLLDKVAVAASEYLNLPGDARHIYFVRRWFVQRKPNAPFAWIAEIERAILKGNTALIALSEVSRDVQEGGFLHLKQTMRHSSTHRFSILHDIPGPPSRESPYIDHYVLGEFVSNLIETLQMARAVLFYFAQMIALHEDINASSSFKAELEVPDHDWIRGENRPE